MIRILAAVLVAAALLPATAQAYSDRQIDAVERAEWKFGVLPGDPVTFHWEDRVGKNRGVYAYTLLNSDGSDYDHTIRLVRGMPASMFCTVVVHEYGHLMGYPHSDNPADVMYPYATPLYTPPICRG